MSGNEVKSKRKVQVEKPSQVLLDFINDDDDGFAPVQNKTTGHEIKVSSAYSTE
jgi:hypothetical protein